MLSSSKKPNALRHLVFGYLYTLWPIWLRGDFRPAGITVFGAWEGTSCPTSGICPGNRCPLANLIRSPATVIALRRIGKTENRYCRSIIGGSRCNANSRRQSNLFPRLRPSCCYRCRRRRYRKTIQVIWCPHSQITRCISYASIWLRCQTSVKYRGTPNNPRCTTNDGTT